MTGEEILERLQGVRQRRDGVYAARCPAHDDHNPSLVVTITPDKTLVCCQAGCSQDVVIEAMGLRMSDLYVAPSNGNGHRNDFVAVYPYQDEQGRTLYEVCRTADKQFPQRRPDGQWGLGGVRRVPYRLPQVLAAVRAGRPVWVCEGEKDVHSLERAGVVATTNPGGADRAGRGKWDPAWNSIFRGATVHIVADRDAPGIAHARNIYRQLDPVAWEVTLHQPATGKDISDHLAAGHTLDDLHPLPLEDSDDQPPVVEERTSWWPLDLTDALNGADVPPPQLLERTDKARLLYPGKVHWFQGESESCKTWAALLAVTQAVQRGLRVGVIDFEDDQNTVVSRLRALGLTVDQIAAQLTYLRPDEPLGDPGKVGPAEVDFQVLLAGPPFDLVVIDGVTEAMLTEGLELISNTDIADWMRRLPKRLAATGAAVVCIDHVTKSREERGRYAIGGQHKLAGISGAAYRFDVVKPFQRAVGVDMATGVITVEVVKDRPGHVRSHAYLGRVATLTLTSYPDGGVVGDLEPPDTTPPADLELCGRIIDHLLTYEGASTHAIESTVEGKTDRVRAALKWMTEPERGWVRVEKKGQSHQHFVTEEGVRALDQQ